MHYRSDIDGLRAIAVLLVFFFHAKIKYFHIGFIGVDIFFVISGYLITFIVTESIENKKFKFLNFYLNRVKRIIPALWFILLISIFYSLLLEPHAARDLSQSITASTLFLQNFLLYIESSNYFDLNTEFKPLLHLWTLSVEGQFYLVFPLILFLADRLNKNSQINLMILLICISLFSYIFFSITDRSFAFYMSFNRFWEFSFGSLLVFIKKKKNINLVNKLDNFFSFQNLGICIILILIILSNFFVINENIIALITVIGSGFILFSERKNTLGYSVLNLPFLVYLGLISYSIYLWHQLVIVIYKNERLEFSSYFSLLELIFIFSLTILLSIMSYYLIEIPFRKKMNSFYLLPILSFVSIIVFTIGIFGHTSYGFQNWKLNSFPESIRSFYIDHFYEANKNVIYTDSIKTDFHPYGILVIGDSMSGDIVSSLYSVGIKARSFGLDGLSMENFVNSDNKNQLFTEVKKSKITIIASDFAGEKNIIGLKLLYQGLTRISKNIKIMSSFRFRHAAFISYLYLQNYPQYEIDQLFNNQLDPRNSINDEIRKFAQNNLIEKANFFCEKNLCKLFDEKGYPLFFDELHLTVNGYNYFGKKLKIILNDFIKF